MRISDWSSDLCSSDFLDGALLNIAEHNLSMLSPSPLNSFRAAGVAPPALQRMFRRRSEEHTSELQSLMRISYAVFCLKKKIMTTCHFMIINFHTFKHYSPIMSSLHYYRQTPLTACIECPVHNIPT